VNRPRWLRQDSKTGFRIDTNIDRNTGIRCPRDNCGFVYYNGNYVAACGWAAEPDDETSPESRAFNQRLYEALRERDG